jgi:hypothetical protein
LVATRHGHDVQRHPVRLSEYVISIELNGRAPVQIPVVRGKRRIEKA